MKKFVKQKLDRKDHMYIDILTSIVRFMITPIFLLVRIYCWVWDYDYNSFKED